MYLFLAILLFVFFVLVCCYVTVFDARTISFNTTRAEKKYEGLFFMASPQILVDFYTPGWTAI